MSTVTALDWRNDAACRDIDSESFFGPADSNRGERLYRWEQLALAVCSVCPVRAPNAPLKPWATRLMSSTGWWVA